MQPILTECSDSQLRVRMVGAPFFAPQFVPAPLCPTADLLAIEFRPEIIRNLDQALWGAP